MSAAVHSGLMALAGKIEGPFPHHAKSIRDELLSWTLEGDGTWTSAPRRMTGDRWNRVADIICSMAALPGTLLTEEAKALRLHALCQAEAARAMARHELGGKRADGALDLALFIVA